MKLTGTVVKVEPLGQVTPRPGDTDPSLATLLRFFDTMPHSYSSYLVAADLGSLLSLASDRKFEVAMELPMRVEGRPETHFFSFGTAIDRRLTGPFPSETRSQFLDYLSRLRTLPAEDLEALSAANKLHYGSVLLAGRDPRSAYLLLVAALEVLSRRYGSPPQEWSAWDESDSWNQLFTSLDLSSDQQEALRDRMMANRHLRLKATFREYISSSLPESFWEKPWEEWLYTLHLPHGTWGEAQRSETPIEDIVPKDRQLIFQALGKTYDLRSGLVHRGDELHLIQTGLKAAEPVIATEAIPYAVLRQMLLALTRTELETRTVPGELPDIQFI